MNVRELPTAARVRPNGRPEVIKVPGNRPNTDITERVIAVTGGPDPSSRAPYRTALGGMLCRSRQRPSDNLGR